MHLHFVAVKYMCVCLYMLLPGLVNDEIKYNSTLGPCQNKTKKHSPREIFKTHKQGGIYKNVHCITFECVNIHQK